MIARNLVTASLLAMSLSACAGSAYDNNIMFGRVDRPLNANDVARERQAQNSSIRSNSLFGHYSDQDLRLSSFALFNCSITPTNPPTAGVFTDAAIVPAGINVQTSDVVIIERGGGRAADGTVVPHRVVGVVKNEDQPRINIDEVNGVELVRCNQPAY